MQLAMRNHRSRLDSGKLSELLSSEGRGREFESRWVRELFKTRALVKHHMAATSFCKKRELVGKQRLQSASRHATRPARRCRGRKDSAPLPIGQLRPPRFYRGQQSTIGCRARPVLKLQAPKKLYVLDLFSAVAHNLG